MSQAAIVDTVSKPGAARSVLGHLAEPRRRRLLIGAA